jgi:diacylglycerol kinase (ATP)
VIASLNYAVAGIVHVLRTQRNMRIHFAVAIAALIAGIGFGVSRGELLAVLLAGAFVIVAEMFNTAIEAAIDVATSSFDPRAKIAKDVAAGSVLISAVVALGVAYVVFADRLERPTASVFERIRTTPVHLTVIALFLVVIAVIALKAATHRGDLLRGGLPSGHAAVAFAGATAIGFITASSAHSVLAISLAFLMAALVAQTRVEAGIHTLGEVALGGVLGVLITLAIFQAA